MCVQYACTYMLREGGLWRQCRCCNSHMAQLMSNCEGGGNSVLLADGAAPVLVAHGPQLGQPCGVTYRQTHTQVFTLKKKHVARVFKAIKPSKLVFCKRQISAATDSLHPASPLPFLPLRSVTIILLADSLP